MEFTHDHIYLVVEKPFIDYFNRCNEIGMGKLEIQKNFKYLTKYYEELVIDDMDVDTIFKIDPTLNKLFNNWCDDNHIK